MATTIFSRVIDGIETFTPEEAKSDDTKIKNAEALSPELKELQRKFFDAFIKENKLDSDDVKLPSFDPVEETKTIIGSQAENGEVVDVTFANAERVARQWKAAAYSALHSSAANRVMALQLLKLDPEPLTDDESNKKKYADKNEKHVRRVRKATKLGWPDLDKLCRDADKELVVKASIARAITDIIEDNKQKVGDRFKKDASTDED